MLFFYSIFKFFFKFPFLKIIDKIREHCKYIEKIRKETMQSGLTINSLNFGYWLFDIAKWWSPTLIEALNNHAKIIKESQEANLSCQIAASEYKPMVKWFTTEDREFFKYYKQEFLKCSRFMENVRRNFICSLCDNDKSDFFNKSQSQEVFKLSPMESQSFIEACALNLDLFYDMIDKYWIIYTLGTCSTDGDESELKDKNSLKRPHVEFRKWIRLCLGYNVNQDIKQIINKNDNKNGDPVEEDTFSGSFTKQPESKDTECVLASDKCPDDVEKYLKNKVENSTRLKPPNTKDNNFCHLITESQMSSSGYTKIEKQNMQLILNMGDVIWTQLLPALTSDDK